MFGRRSHQRFTISTSPEGTLRMIRDVLVERFARDQVIVISRYPGVVGETVTLQMGQGAGMALVMRVGESRPVVADGTVRHRIALHQKEPPAGQGGVASTPEQDPLPMIAVLARDVPVRVMNCSSSGCLLESAAPIEVGRVASLRIALNGEELVDDLQIVRCRPIEGSSSYHAGAEFLWTAPPRQQSLRMGIGRTGDVQAQPAARG